MKLSTLRFEMRKMLQPRLRTVLPLLALAAFMLSFAPSAHAQDVLLTLPDIEGSVGEEITIPIQATNLEGQGVYSFILRIAFDPDVLSEDFSSSTSGTLAAGVPVNVGLNPPVGTYTIFQARNAVSQQFESDGTLINLKTTVVGEGTTSLELSYILLENGGGEVATVAESGSFTTEVVQTDPDGIPDTVENGVPNPDGSGTGDGNGDGTPDSEQANVASLKNATDAGYVTVASNTGTRLRNVAATNTPPSPAPAGVNLPDGVVSFEVIDLDAGASATVDIYTSHAVTGYYKYGPTPANPSDHWYLFDYDGTTGAEIDGDVITLHFVDGLRGDGDLEANGEIDDPGAPAFFTNLAPEAPEITSPTAGAEIVIGGGSGDNPQDPGATLLTIEWDAVTDPDGDAVTYQVDVSSDESFGTTLDSFSLSNETELDVTVAQAAAWFDEAYGESEVGADTDLHIRVVASDGETETSSETTSVTFVRGTVTSMEDGEIPGGFALRGNYPNPFNPSTTIRFDLARQAEVSVAVYDLLGRNVMAVPARTMQPGTDLRIDMQAGALSSGTYVYRVTAEMANDVLVRSGRMTLVK